MRQAVDLYTSFREAKPTKLARIKVDVPKVVAQMGHVEAIDYLTTHKGKTTLYRHKFAKGSRPLLCVSGDGTQLMLLGGRYEWTDRGIQDADAKGRLIENPKHGKTLNPRKSAPAHICPICNKSGGSHVPDALRKLGMPGEYAHPRCVTKSFVVQKGYAPPGAVVKNRAYYFETHDDARQYAIQHGLPADRIVPYSSGWAVQIGARGRFVQKKRVLAGNPKSPARKLTQQQFAKYVQAFNPSKESLRRAVALFKADPVYWSRLGFHRLFQVVGDRRHNPKYQHLETLVDKYNESTHPGRFRTEHGHARNKAKAQAILKRIESMGYRRGLDFYESEHSGALRSRYPRI